MVGSHKGPSTDPGRAGGPARSSVEVLARRGGGGAKGPGHLWLSFVRSTGVSGRYCMSELKSSGKPFDISRQEV